MPFADLCSNGLIICWPYNLIPSGQPLFSSCFMITYTSQVQMNNILLEQKKHMNSEEENFSSSCFSCYCILKETYHLEPSTNVMYKVLNSGCLTNAEIDNSKRQYNWCCLAAAWPSGSSSSHRNAYGSSRVTLRLGLELPDFQVLAYPWEKPSHPCFQVNLAHFYN